MKILGKKPSESASVPGETSVFRKRGFTVETSLKDDNAEPSALPEKPTQLEHAERNCKKISQMKVHGNRPVVELKLAAPQLQTQSEAGSKFMQRHELKPIAFNHQQVGRQIEEAPVPALALSPEVHRQAEAELASPTVQAKLVIGAPGDKYELEADRVASLVVNQINAPVSVPPSQNLQREQMSEEDELHLKSETDTIQREEQPEEELQMKPMLQLQAGDDGVAATPDLESSIQQARGSGQSLAENIRKPIERAFGADFSGVKVHTDRQSDQLNRSIQARAFTTGQDVFFRSGEYNPGSRGGQELLAHELTHVVQQGGALRMNQETMAANKLPTQQAPEKFNQELRQVERPKPRGLQMKLTINNSDEKHQTETENQNQTLAPQQSTQNKYEQEADLMGEQAAEKAKAASAVNVVQRATDMESLKSTVANQKYQEDQNDEKTVKELVDMKYPDVKRDANYNNIDKRKFEEQLAVVVWKNLDAVWAPVIKVSQNILKYIESKANGEKDKILNSLNKLSTVTGTLGASGFNPQSDDFSVDKGSEILQDKTKESLPTHLNIHNKFYSGIYQLDYLQKEAEVLVGKIEGASYNAVLKLAGTEHKEGYHPLKTLQPDELFSTNKLNENNPEIGRPRKDASMEKRSEKAQHISGLEPFSEDQELITENKLNDRPTHVEEEHKRGIDMFYLNEFKLWTQKARIALDMPLSAGPSGSTAFMLTPALEMGVSGQEEILQYTMALVGSMIAGGHHTFHEIMTIAKIAGVPYSDGSYKGVYPESLKKCADFQQLVKEYPQFLGDEA